jgi:hypothetical protein
MTPPEEISIENETKKCPACAETIKLEAKKCRHCGEVFDKIDVDNQIEQRLAELKLKQQKSLEDFKDKMEKTAKGLKQCVTCGNWDVYRAVIEDGGQGDWCPHCKQSLQKMGGKI